MSEDKKTGQKPHNFVITTDAPRFATRILATVNQDAVVLSFGSENPLNASESHMHTRIAMPLRTLESFKKLLERIASDLETKKAMEGVRYDQIPSDS